MLEMSIPNKIIDVPTYKPENTVYLYSKKLKITYSSLEDLKYFISKLFDQNQNLDEKLYQCQLFLKNLYKELYKKGILNEDHTMVITDPVVEKKMFINSLEAAFNKTINTKKKSIKPSLIRRHKRLFIIALFIKKNYLLKDLLNITLGTDKFYCKILSKEINIQSHSRIKFKPTKELEEYIINLLTRKALLTNGGSVYALKLYLPIILELVIWYSRSLAYIEKGKEVNDKMLSSAIKIVDNHYITNPMFLSILKSRFLSHLLKILN